MCDGRRRSVGKVAGACATNLVPKDVKLPFFQVRHGGCLRISLVTFCEDRKGDGDSGRLGLGGNGGNSKRWPSVNLSAGVSMQLEVRPTVGD